MSVLRKILEDLDWRSRYGKPLGHVVLTRYQAQQLLMNIGVKLTDSQSYNPYHQMMGISEERPITEKDLT